MIKHIKILYLFFIVTLLTQCNIPQENTNIHLPVKEGYIAINDSLELFYQLVGSGKDTIILLHGGPGLPSYYLMPDLKPLAFQYTLLFYDQRGSGRSTPIKDTLLLDAQYYIYDLEMIRQYFSIEKMNLIGHSWGGLLAGIYAASYPMNIDQLVLIGSCPSARKYSYEDFEPSLWAKLDSLTLEKMDNLWEAVLVRPDTVKACWDYWTELIKAYYSNQELTRRMWGDVCNCPSSTIWGHNPYWYYTMKSLGNWDLTEDMKDFTFPVLIIHGEDDPMPLGCAQAWVDLLPNAQLSVIENAGHFPQVEKPDIFFYQVDEFFKGTWPIDIEKKSIEIYENILNQPWSLNKALAEITVPNRKFMEEIKNQDSESLSNLYTKDGLIMAPTAPPVCGHISIKAFWQSAMNKGLAKAELQTIDLEGDKEQLIEIGKYTLYNKDDSILDIGKYLIVWKRVNNKWLISKDMFNSNMKKPCVLYEWEPEYLF